jgi:hypothetical protein
MPFLRADLTVVLSEWLDRASLRFTNMGRFDRVPTAEFAFEPQEFTSQVNTFATGSCMISAPQNATRRILPPEMITSTSSYTSVE